MLLGLAGQYIYFHRQRAIGLVKVKVKGPGDRLL